MSECEIPLKVNWKFKFPLMSGVDCNLLFFPKILVPKGIPKMGLLAGNMYKWEVHMCNFEAGRNLKLDLFSNV